MLNAQTVSYFAIWNLYIDDEGDAVGLFKIYGNANSLKSVHWFVLHSAGLTFTFHETLTCHSIQ